MKTPLTRLVLPLLIAATAAASAPLHADPEPKKNVVFKKDFSTAPLGSIQSDPPDLVLWTGTEEQPLGKTTIVEPPASLSAPAAKEGEEAAPAPKAVLLVSSTSKAPSGMAPGVVTKAPGVARGGKGKAVFQYRLAVPVDGPYRTDIFFGGAWNDANAAIFILKDGAISTAQRTAPGTADKKPEYQPMKIGDYVPNQWMELRFVFDLEQKTYSVYLNGKALANGFPWNDPDSGLGSGQLAVGFDAKDEDAPSLYLHQVEIWQE